jgi:hypothetical protein
MKKLLLPWVVLHLLAVSGAYAQKVTVQISVTQATHEKETPHAFPGVGLFEIFRGEQPFQGAECPDMSNNQGKLTCTVTCDSSDSTSKQLRLVPPSKAHRVRGFIPPLSADLSLKGCALSPRAPGPFVYRDSKLVLRLVLKDSPQMRALFRRSADFEVIEFAGFGTAMPVMQQVASTHDGPATLVQFNRAASAFIEGRDDPDPVMTAALSKYQIAIYNVLLGEIAKQKVGLASTARLKITTSKDDYYANLLQLEAALDQTVGRTAEQNLLLGDVQALKRQPIDAIGDYKLYRHVPGTRGTERFIQQR